MNKKYKRTQLGSKLAAEPMVVSDAHNNNPAPMQEPPTKKCAIEDTVSVDEYFDTLISQVHNDYAIVG